MPGGSRVRPKRSKRLLRWILGRVGMRARRCVLSRQQDTVVSNLSLGQDAERQLTAENAENAEKSRI